MFLFPDMEDEAAPVLRQAQSLEFAKLQGLGNDFVMVDNRASSSPLVTAQQASALCNRHLGIGADGVVLLMEGASGCDYSMRIFNADGSEPEMCGNGLRCLAKFAFHLEGQPSGAIASYKVWTKAGPMTTTITTDGSVTVDMGEPILVAEKVPCTLPADSEGRAIGVPLQLGESTVFATAVSMGNPHCVVLVDSIDSMLPPFSTAGPLLESHAAFPQRVNAEFVQVLSSAHLRMRVWERGAGPTLACGTGACAAVVAACLANKADRQCLVSLPGGDLHVHWAESNHVFLTGPAELVFRGQIDLSRLPSQGGKSSFM